MKYTNPHPGRYEHSSRKRNIRKVTHMVEYIDAHGKSQSRIAYDLSEATAIADRCRAFKCANIVVFENVAGHWVAV